MGVGSWQSGIGFEEDRLGNTVRIVLDLAVPEASDFPTQALKECRSHLISLDEVGVLASVEFDGEPYFSTGEIEYVGSHHKLTRETRTIAGEPHP